jgi:hypothetical protein
MQNNIIKFHCYKGTSWLSKLIKFRTLSEYSHIAIEIDNIVYEAWTSDGCNGGVKSHSPLFYHSEGTKFDTYSFEMKNIQKYKNFLEMQVGKKYDWKAIFNFALNWNKQNSDAWFCSELADLFFIFEIQNYIAETKLVSPGRFVDKIHGY